MLGLWAILWALGTQSLLLGEFIIAGLALDTLRHHAAPDTAPAPQWPFGFDPPAQWPLWQTVGLAAAIVLAFTVIRAVGGYGSRVSSERFIQAIVVDLRSRLYRKIHRLGFRYFDANESGGLINRVTGDAQSVRLFVEGVAVRLVIAGLAAALFIGWMLTTHIWLTLAVLAVVPVQVWVMRRYTLALKSRHKQLREAMDRLIQFLAESIIAAKVVRGFGQEPAMIRRFQERVDAAQHEHLRLARANADYSPAFTAAGFLQLAILVGYGGVLVARGPAEGGIGLGALWVFLNVLRRLSGQVESIVQTMSTLPDALTGASRVFELLDAPETIASPDGGGWNGPVRGRITFENVWFSYRGDGEPFVLRDLSFEIDEGETVAVVGLTGAGKSTLMKLIARCYDPDRGRILIDGVDLREWNLHALRRGIGIVFQEPFLFSNTVSNNIAFGQPEADLESIRRAAESAAASDFIDALPDRFDTRVGERGLTLSGGERQRLCLARALLIHPQILLLDDAMAAVDARTETAILDALNLSDARRTTLLVTHRLSTLAEADRIIVLENGAVTEIGRHDELMRTNAHYRETARLQLQAVEEASTP